MHGPSPAVNCRRSASSATSWLAPRGTRRWEASRRLMPAPSTPSTWAQARASRTGSSSGPARSCPSLPASAAVNRSAMVTPHYRTPRAPRRLRAISCADHGPVDDAGAGAVREVLPCGDRALLVEVDGLDAVRALAAALERSPLPGQQELVPAARTVLVRLDRPPADTDSARLRRLAAEPVPDLPDVPPVELPVVFDGPDLAEVAGLTGRSASALVAAPTGLELTVAFTGFAPGFGYLTGLPEDLRVPRRATPRTRVPAGSVGLAGPYAGAYPRASPGGWQLVGRTDAVLFDVDRDPPALLVPGARVRLREVR